VIYITCFLLSALFAYFAHKATDKKQFFLFSALSILLPTLLAGLRAYEIGIDTISYMTKKRY
jgi:hypothetical protein